MRVLSPNYRIDQKTIVPVSRYSGGIVFAWKGANFLWECVEMAIRSGRPKNVRRNPIAPSPQKAPAQKAKETSKGAEAAEAKSAPVNTDAAVPAKLSSAAARQQDEAATDFTVSQSATIPQSAKSPLALRMAVLKGDDIDGLAKDLENKTSTGTDRVGKGITGAQGSLSGTAMYTSAPGSVGRPSVAEDAGVNYKTLAYGARGGWTFLKDTNDDGGMDSSHTTGAALNRAGVSVSAGDVMSKGVGRNGAIFV